MFVEGIVNKVLERSRAVIKSKGHNKVFEEAIARSESCFLLITVFNLKTVKSRNNI
jgi:hypothetical protein